MSLNAAIKYLEGYESGYLAGLKDASSLASMDGIDFETEVSYLGIAVVDHGRTKIIELQQIAKDLGLEDD